MAHFYAEIQGSRGSVHRLGGASGGISTLAASYSGAVSTHLYVKDGVDCARVTLGKWQGVGPDSTVIYDGPINPPVKPGKRAKRAA